MSDPVRDLRALADDHFRTALSRAGSTGSYSAQTVMLNSLRLELRAGFELLAATIQADQIGGTKR